jgi:hypothetical protein
VHDQGRVQTAVHKECARPDRRKQQLHQDEHAHPQHHNHSLPSPCPVGTHTHAPVPQTRALPLPSPKPSPYLHQGSAHEAMQCRCHRSVVVRVCKDEHGRKQQLHQDEQRVEPGHAGHCVSGLRLDAGAGGIGAHLGAGVTRDVTRQHKERADPDVDLGGWLGEGGERQVVRQTTMLERGRTDGLLPGCAATSNGTLCEQVERTCPYPKKQAPHPLLEQKQPPPGAP